VIHHIQSDNITWIYLKISCCPLILSSTVMDYTSRIRSNTWLCASCCAWLDGTSLVSGLGVENQTNERPATSLCFTPLVFVLWWSIKKPNVKSKNTLWIGTRNSTIFCNSSSGIHKEKCWVYLFQVAEICAKCSGPCRNLLPYGSAWAVKWCKNTSSIVFHLEDVRWITMCIHFPITLYKTGSTYITNISTKPDLLHCLLFATFSK